MTEFRPKVVRTAGFSLIEVLTIVSIVGLLYCIAALNLTGSMHRQDFKGTVESFVSTLRLAASGSLKGDRRFEIVIDLADQTYLLREITTDDLSEVLDEEIVSVDSFGKNCRVEYVEFDDGTFNRDDGDGMQIDRVRLRVGRFGWQYGAKIVLMDRQEQPYSVLINRLNRQIRVVPGDVTLPGPKEKAALWWTGS